MSLSMNCIPKPQHVDKWSWEYVSNEFRTKISSAAKDTPKELENSVVKIYLVNECKGCTQFPCLNYHAGQKPRRAVFLIGNTHWNYKPKKCGKIGCKNQKCGYAHTREEINFHPLTYKTISCKFALVDGICSKFNHFCPFIHDGVSENIDPNKVIDSEKFNIDTFKTEKCQKKYTHDFRECSYYHVSDRRRNITKFQYSNEICKRINCREKDACNKCHSNAEYMFHPMNYKTAQCLLQNCKNKEFCPYYHESSEKNESNIEDKEFKYSDILKKCQSLNQELENQQEKSKKFKNFLCCLCYENKSKFVLRCGHTKCDACIITALCSICSKITEPMIPMQLTR